MASYLMHNDGYIQYNCEWTHDELSEEIISDNLVAFRNILYSNKYIGVYPDGVGYGNVSERKGTTESFSISGTQTGHIEHAGKEHFSYVYKHSIENNTIWCKGKVKASSEALTHAAFYLANEKIKAVIHAHHHTLWKKLLYISGTTHKSVTYGTTEMSKEIFRLLKTDKVLSEKIVITAGHADGIFTFGSSLEEAYAVLNHFSSQIKIG